MQLQKYIQGLITSSINIRFGTILLKQETFQIEIVKARTQLFELRTQIIHFVQCLSEKEKTKIERGKFLGNNRRLMNQAKLLTDKIEIFDKLIE